MNKLITFLIFSISISGFTQIENNKDLAVSLGITKNWCSDKGEYSTEELTLDQPKGSCYDKPFMYGKWFKFLATSNNIEALVKIGNGDGTMQFPYLYLIDESLSTIECIAPLDDTTNISIKSSKLIIGSWYYLAVYNHNHSKYVGTFTLCVNNEISNDFIEGAYDVFNTNEWCSENGEFTTLKGTPDEKKPSCLSNGPNFNKWFKFTAQSKEATIEVKYGKYFGTCQFPYVALWDENYSEIACDKYTDDHQQTKIISNDLTPNKKYYISVDHQFNEKYQGTFTLCVDNRADKMNEVIVKSTDLQNANLEVIVGKLMYNIDYKPIKQLKISLFESGIKVKTTTTDVNGRFIFNNIEPNKNFMIVIEDVGDELLFAIYQTKSNGDIVKQMVRHNKTDFGFEELQTSCNKIVLLDCNRSFDLNISPGKIGMIGKVVNKKSPTNSINNVGVYLYDNSKKILDSTKTNLNGDFQFINLVDNDNYMIKLGISLDEVFAELLIINDVGNAISSSSSKNASEDGFFSFQKLPYMEAATLAKLNFEDFDVNFDEELTTGKTIILNNIYFNAGENELLPNSFLELDKLVALMKKNQTLKIEIGGHTDNFGTNELNLSLSKNRALSVEKYLLAKGVEANRLSHKGYGSTKPIADNETAEGRKKNRRVEFLIK